MEELKIKSSGNVQKDFDEFIDGLVYKFNINDRESFQKDLFEFLSKNIKQEYIDMEKLKQEVISNEEKMNDITRSFFELIDRHSAGFDFYEGAEQEVIRLKREREKG